MQKAMIKRAAELLKSGTVDRVIGWRQGEFGYDFTPSVFKSADELEKDFVYNIFCGANLSKYLIKETEKEGRILAFLKPCDTYSFNQLLTEHKIDREKVYVIGVGCSGTADIRLAKNLGIDGICGIKSIGDEVVFDTLYGDKSVKTSDIIAERCVCCNKNHVVYDELIGENGMVKATGRFDMVAKLEKMTPDERYDFWRGELSRCIRCNACRNVCPACTCVKCVFDNPASGVDQKAAADSFEENMFHIIRAFHVAGRCTDCGECSRVCPEQIPLHLLNRKFIKDINELYGDYTAGEVSDQRSPLVSYTQADPEPSVVEKRSER